MATQNSSNNTVTSNNFTVPAGSITASGAISSSAGALSAFTTVTGGTGVTATTGNIAASAGQVNAATTMTAGAGITATTGDIAASAGAVSAATTVTGGTGVIATTGNIVASAGQVNANTTMTAGTGITATTGNITASAGAVSASTTVTGGTGVTATTGNLTASSGVLRITDTIGSDMGIFLETESSVTGSNIVLSKNRSGGALTSGDAIGSVSFVGNDGTNPINTSQITCTSSGTIAATRIGSDLKFWTHPDSAGANVLRMTVNPAGTIVIATPDAGTALTIQGGGINSTGAVTLNGGALNFGTDNAANAISMGVGTTARVIGIGNSAAAHTITLGTTNAGSTLTLNTPTGTQISAANGLNAVAGNISSAAGAVSANTTVTAGTNLVSTAGNLLLPTTSATVGQIQINANRVFHSYGAQNMFLGTLSGNFTLTGTGNTTNGYNCMPVLTNGASNTAIGRECLLAVTTGSNNSGIGHGALGSVIGGDKNNSFGYISGGLITSGSNNLGLGHLAFVNAGITTGLVTGSYNIGIGTNAGGAYTGAESSNVLLNNLGVVGESNVMRLGTTGGGAGQQNKTWIAGSYGITPDVATIGEVIQDNTGQLGTQTRVVSTAWTPVLKFGGGVTGITYTTETGRYSQHGDTVTFTLNLVMTSKGSDVGAATITGLPVACGNNCSLSVFYSKLTALGMVTATLTGSTISLYSANILGGAATALADTDFANDTSLTISGSYIV